MIHAYNEIYLESVMRNVADVFDIAINPLCYEPDDFAIFFSSSLVALNIEEGNPLYLAGKSASEMLSILLDKYIVFDRIPSARSKEYWAGWVASYAEWYFNISFKELFEIIPLSELISLYHPYHEAPLEKTIKYIKAKMSIDSPLKTIRQKRKLSQKQLSILSGVKLRSIECYEQGDIDIRKAQGETLFALAKSLDCKIEDLLK